MIWRAPLALLIGPMLTTAASALTLDLPGEAAREIVAYACSDGIDRRVEYVNLDHDSLALLEIGGVRRIFVNVLSGSGAKYVSGSNIWWNKGDEAMLDDEAAGEGAAPVTCSEKSDG